MLEQGQGSKVNKQKAKELYKKAAQQNNASAQLKLAQMILQELSPINQPGLETDHTATYASGSTSLMTE